MERQTRQAKIILIKKEKVGRVRSPEFKVLYGYSNRDCGIRGKDTQASGTDSRTRK